MNIYDAAHNLADCLRKSAEYRKLLDSKQVLAQDPDAEKMVKDIITKKIELEYAVLAGQKDKAAAGEQLEKLYNLLAYNSKAVNFLEAYTRMQIILGDVYKILGDAVAEGIDFLAKDER